MQFPLWHEVGIIVVKNTTVVGEKEERIQRNKSDMLVLKKVNSGYFNNACFEHRARYKWYKMIWVKGKNSIRSVFSDHLLLFSVPANVLYCTLLWNVIHWKSLSAVFILFYFFAMCFNRGPGSQYCKRFYSLYLWSFIFPSKVTVRWFCHCCMHYIV